MALSKQKMLMVAPVAAAILGYGIYRMVSGGSKKAPVHNFFEDPAFGESRTLYKKEAFKRSSQVSKVNYRLVWALLRGGKTFHGHVEINFSLDSPIIPDDLFVDYKGERVFSLIVNDHQVTEGNPFKDHRIYLPQDLLVRGQNSVKIRFESKYVKDCQGIHYFKDKEDDEEYLYSQFEAADAHKAFPCFDQPDIKAPYRLAVFVPKGWKVISTSHQKRAPSDAGSIEMLTTCADFGVSCKEFTELFADEPCQLYEFKRSPKISVYLYSVVAGPYHEFPSDQPDLDFVPMNIYCRKSLVKYVEKAKNDWFHVSRCALDYYSKIFNFEFPFEKLDQCLIPDYNMGAMENVGCVTYRDDFIQRDELFSPHKQQAIYNVILHELSHMWFGNLVTMKWWDDLWLNESFANFVSYLCMDQAEGLEQYTAAWSLFLNQSFWGLSTDQKPTTHPISTECIHTTSAQDIFDGISYGKGASYLNQAFFQLGQPVFQDGLSTYFEEFQYKNTELKDFIGHLDSAAKKAGKKIDLIPWTETWLKSAGCCHIWLDIVEEGGKIKKFTVNQKPHKNGEGNKLRVQKFQVVFYDDKMKILKTVDIDTKDDKESFDLTEVHGTPAAHGYHINYKNKGYGKFRFDDKTLDLLEEKLHLIEDSMSRKQIYLILADMLTDNDLAGARCMNIIKKNLPKETAVDVISNCLNLTIPLIIKMHIPVDMYEEQHKAVFEMILEQMLPGGHLTDNATKHLVVESLINSARNDEHIKVVEKWFYDGKLSALDGKPLESIELSLKHKHFMVRQIWSSLTMPLEQKQKALDKIKELDKGEWTTNTERIVKSSHLANKKDMWTFYFSDDAELETWGLHDYQQSFQGFNQVMHRKETAQFEEAWFDKITDVVSKKGRFVALEYFHRLKPTNRRDQDLIDKYNALLKKTETEQSDNTFFIKMINDTITDLETMKRGCETTVKYLNKK